MPLPSPNRLRRKIIIKNKRLKPDVEKCQMEQYLKKGLLPDEDDDVQGEYPQNYIGEDPPSTFSRRMLFHLFIFSYFCFIHIHNHLIHMH